MLTKSSIVRQSAKELTSLILDEERLRAERSDRKAWKSRVTGIEEYGPQGSGFAPGEVENTRRRQERRRPQASDDDDAEYRLAIEASKHEAEEDKKRRQSSAAVGQDDDLEKAIKLSKEEEELRRKELEESNAASLFDDTPSTSQQQQPQYTGFNQGYQQQGAVDWFGNPVDQQAQQPQSTGYLNNAYNQPTGFQPQQTGFQNGFQPQQAGFDQTQFQQQPNYLQQQNTIQPQQTAFDNFNNPYGQQQNVFGNQFGQQQQQPRVSTPTAGNHNPWATNQQQPADFQKPLQTGSNNPFASSRPQVQQQQSSPPTLSTLAEQRTATQFNQQPSYNPIANYQPPKPQSPPINQKEQNPQHARLNALLASGEGMDTFGNTGDLRIPAQHTAPGVFVNSAGQGLNRLQANQTGNNPFFNQHQFTGAPQQQNFGGFGGSQQFPAQTGPANAFGQPSNNPFGSRPPQGQAQGGSLIDL